MWQVHENVKDSELKLLKNKGINTVQSFRVVTLRDEVVRSYLDRMAAHGLSVVLSVQWFLLRDDYGRWTQSIDSNGLDSFLNKWRSHPALFAWHAIDEPVLKGFTKDFQRTVYAFIKARDPDRPVLLSWNGTEERHYECCFDRNSFDILDLHAYPTGDSYQRQEQLVTLFRKMVPEPHFPVILTIRGFNGGSWPHMRKGHLQVQYDRAMGFEITGNIGIYGWWLDPHVGLSQDSHLHAEFLELKRHRK